MSKRRKSGDWVWLMPNSGFVGESHRLKTEIQPEDAPPPCMWDCDDPGCIEWSTLWTEDGGDGRHMLCHVSECQMFDEPFGDETKCQECLKSSPAYRCQQIRQFRAEAIWAVLVAVCGADPDGLDGFVFHANMGSEYRFQGNSGFGGKVYIESPPRVSCYSEDESPERLEILDSANRLLAAIAKLWQ